MSATPSKSATLYQKMRHDILAIRLAPGAALPLPMLSERYGIGLTPLRDCLNRLTMDRLVVTEHNKGFRVAPLSRADLLDLEHTRSTIEGALFVTSVQQGDDAWEGRVVATFHHLSKTPFPSVLQAAADLATWNIHHAAFHRALISGAPSAWMHRFCDQLADQLGRYHLFIQDGLRDLSATHPDRAAAADAAFSTAMDLAGHRALYDLAMARDATGALELFEEHANLSIAAFEKLMRLLPQDTQVAATLSSRQDEANA